VPLIGRPHAWSSPDCFFLIAMIVVFMHTATGVSRRRDHRRLGAHQGEQLWRFYRQCGCSRFLSDFWCFFWLLVNSHVLRRSHRWVDLVLIVTWLGVTMSLVHRLHGLPMLFRSWHRSAPFALSWITLSLRLCCLGFRRVRIRHNTVCSRNGEGRWEWIAEVHAVLITDSADS